MKGKSKSTNGCQFAGPSVKQTVRYEPKVTTSAPKKGTTNKGNASTPSSMLKTTGTSFKKDNISTSKSFSALIDDEENEDEAVENVYDESDNLLLNTKIGGNSSFTAADDTMAEDSFAQIKASGPNDALAEGKSREEQEDPAGLILIDPEGAEYSYALRVNFANSNNDAEYEAMLTGLRIAAKIKVNAIIEEITRTWMTPTQEYIEHGILPEDAVEARTIQEKARNYTIEEGVLYPKSYLGPLLRCIGSNDEIPPPPSQTPTQQAPHTVSTIKLLILKKGEYDIWSMKMEHYLGHTDYPIWEVIQKGNGHVQVLTDTNGQINFLPPKTAEEILARKRERKARTTLLMAIPEDHLAKIHKMTDAKEMFQSLLSQLKIHGVDTLSFDDLYNNFRVFESDVKGSTASSSSTHNVALVSSKSTSSTYEASTAYGVSTSSSHNSQREGSSSYNNELMYSFFANQSNGPQLDHKDLERLNEFDLEEMDLK
nr:ribonuclease H-like domain-containing protein [Tanacetum cinerariifolium]